MFNIKNVKIISISFLWVLFGSHCIALCQRNIYGACIFEEICIFGRHCTVYLTLISYYIVLLAYTSQTLYWNSCCYRQYSPRSRYFKKILQICFFIYKIMGHTNFYPLLNGGTPYPYGWNLQKPFFSDCLRHKGSLLSKFQVFTPIGLGPGLLI